MLQVQIMYGPPPNRMQIAYGPMPYEPTDPYSSLRQFVSNIFSNLIEFVSKNIFLFCLLPFVIILTLAIGLIVYYIKSNAKKNSPLR